MTRLFVDNLSFDVTPLELRAAFAAYGRVTSADVVSNGGSGRSGFVEMGWEAHARAAIQGLNGTVLRGRTINVSRAGPRSDGGSRGNPPRGWDVRRERCVDGD